MTKENDMLIAYFSKIGSNVMKVSLATIFHCLAIFLIASDGLAGAIYVPTSPGELFDKITILEIKQENIQDKAKLENINRELALLKSVVQSRPELQCAAIRELQEKLKLINQILWAIEDLIREAERSAFYVKNDSKEGARFGETFILLARLVYFVNDQRVAIKRRINEYAKSDLQEEKEYSSYQQ